MGDPLDRLENELSHASVARVAVANKWTSCIAFCVLAICVTAIVLGLVDILHHG